MGYYSDVLIITTDDIDQKLRNELKSESKDLQEKVIELLDNQSLKLFNPETKNHLYYWEFIKWYTRDYDHFPAVSWIDDKLLNEDEIDNYRYYIVGEELGDIQDFGSLFDNKFDAYPHQYIHFNKQ